MVYVSDVDVFSRRYEWRKQFTRYCFHFCLVIVILLFSVYYASGTSLSKFPEEGIVIAQTLKDQGKSGLGIQSWNDDAIVKTVTLI